MIIRKEEFFEGINKEVLFDFLSNPLNIEKVYPKDLKVKVKSLEGKYQISAYIMGQRFEWLLSIKELERPTKIVDELKGTLFREWKNVHIIKETEKGSLMQDEIYYKTKLGFLGDILIKKFIERIIDYRNKFLLKTFGKEISYEYKDPFKISIFSGTLILSAMFFFSLFILLFIPRGLFFDLLLGLISWFLIWYSSHDLAHFLVGNLVGVKFSNYYIGLSNLFRINWIPERIRLLIIAFGLKIDRTSTTASKKGYFAMYLAGPVASLIMPFIPAFYLLYSGSSLAGSFLLILSLANLAFGLYFSPKYGCINKALRSLKR